MNRHEQHEQIVSQETEHLLDTLFPQGDGYINRHRTKWALGKIAQRAFNEGRSYALLSLLTINDVAEYYSITPARIRVIADEMHRRFTIGAKIGGRWIFTPEDLPMLEPGERGTTPERHKRAANKGKSNE